MAGENAYISPDTYWRRDFSTYGACYSIAPLAVAGFTVIYQVCLSHLALKRFS